MLKTIIAGMGPALVVASLALLVSTILWFAHAQDRTMYTMQRRCILAGGHLFEAYGGDYVCAKLEEIKS